MDRNKGKGLYLLRDTGACQDMAAPSTEEGSGWVQTPEQPASKRGVRIYPESCPKGKARPAPDSRPLDALAAWQPRTRPRSATAHEGLAPGPAPAAEGALRCACRMLKSICRSTASPRSCDTICRWFSTPETGVVTPGEERKLPAQGLAPARPRQRTKGSTLKLQRAPQGHWR